jgi:acyl carrier protein
MSLTDVSNTLDLLRAELRKVKDTLPADVDSGALLMTDLGLDSLDVVEFVARVEEVYRISVPDDDWQQLSTLDRIAKYVTAHRR